MGLMGLGLRVVFDLPEERAAGLAEGLTIVAFWSELSIQKARSYFAPQHSVE